MTAARDLIAETLYVLACAEKPEAVSDYLPDADSVVAALTAAGLSITATPEAECIGCVDEPAEDCPQHGRGNDGWVKYATELIRENNELHERLRTSTPDTWEWGVRKSGGTNPARDIDAALLDIKVTTEQWRCPARLVRRRPGTVAGPWEEADG